ncbi:hypothetical protein EOM60_02820 [Candidatus Saccharibacteria bacterium]|nr:hypothetical protein [Candidatus Saccharibacteria bacterium]
MESPAATVEAPAIPSGEGGINTPYGDFEKKFSLGGELYSATFEEDSEPEKPRKSSSVDRKEIDSEPQAQTYVITDKGVFPVDKADEPAEIRNAYELTQTAEQKKIIEEIKISTEQQHIEVLFKTVTNDQGQTEKHYSVQTFTPEEKPDPKGRQKFVLSSELRIDIVDKEELESESDGSEEKSATTETKQVEDPQVDPVEKNQETETDEKSQTTKQTSQEPIKSEPKKPEAKEVHSANASSSPSDTPDTIPPSTAPRPDSEPEDPTPTGEPLGEPLRTADSPDTSKAGTTVNEQPELSTPQPPAESPADVHEGTPVASEAVVAESSGETTEGQTIIDTPSQFTSEPMVATKNNSDIIEAATEQPSQVATSDTIRQTTSSSPVAETQSHNPIKPQETVSIEEFNKNQIAKQEVTNPRAEVAEQQTSNPQVEATATNPEPVHESKAQDQQTTKRDLEKPSVSFPSERIATTPTERPKETTPVTAEPLTAPSHEAPQPSSEVSLDSDLTMIIDSYSDTAQNPENTTHPKVSVSFESSPIADVLSSTIASTSATNPLDHLRSRVLHFPTFTPVTSDDLTAVFTNRKPSKRRRPASLAPMTTEARA